MINEIDRLQIIIDELLALKNPDGGPLQEGLMKYLWIDACIKVVEKHMTNAIEDYNARNNI